MGVLGFCFCQWGFLLSYFGWIKLVFPITYGFYFYLVFFNPVQLVAVMQLLVANRYLKTTEEEEVPLLQEHGNGGDW